MIPAMPNKTFYSFLATRETTSLLPEPRPFAALATRNLTTVLAGISYKRR
jgi:hypothetical protein